MIKKFKDVKTGRIFEIPLDKIFEGIQEKHLEGCGLELPESECFKSYNGVGNMFIITNADFFSKLAWTEKYFSYWDGSNFVAVLVETNDMSCVDVEEIDWYF